MSDTERNKKLIRSVFDELSRGNGQVWLDAMAPDVVFTIIGSTPFSGTFHGKEEFLRRAMEPMQARLEPGSARLNIERLIAEGEYVVMLADGQARTRDGLAHNNTYAMVFRIREERITEVREYLDTALVEAVFGG